MATVVLSPHLDDAVLSCWHMLAGPGEVSVVNVFAGVPPADRRAGWWDISSGSNDSSEAVMGRIEEDRVALALAGKQAVNLEFLDHQYRDADQSLQEVVDALRAVVPAGAEMWAPAALPRIIADPQLPLPFEDPHPDHVIVREAAQALHGRGYSAALYADLPHASVGGWPRWVTGARARSRIEEEWDGRLARAGISCEAHSGKTLHLSAEDFAQKLKAVRTYESQISSLERAFGRVDDPELLGYEVVWRLPRQ